MKQLSLTLEPDEPSLSVVELEPDTPGLATVDAGPDAEPDDGPVAASAFAEDDDATEDHEFCGCLEFLRSPETATSAS